MEQDTQPSAEAESPAVDKLAQDLQDTMLGAARASGTGKRPKPVTKAAAQEAEYDAQEFARNPALFGVSADMVTAALSFFGITRCTLSDAKEHVKKYAERQV